MPDDAAEPSPEQAASAVKVVLHGGKRSTFNVNTAVAESGGTVAQGGGTVAQGGGIVAQGGGIVAQGGGGGSDIVNTNLFIPAEHKESGWTKSIAIWTVIIAIIAGVTLILTLT